MSERQDKRGGAADPLAPATEEELAAAKRLRDAIEDPTIPSDDAEVARAMKAAWSPDALSEDELDAIVAASVEGGSAEGAAELAAVLEGSAPTTAESELALALRHAWAPRALDDAEHAAIVAKAVSGATATAPRSRGVVVRVAFGASVSVLALAASVLLYLNVQEQESPTAPLARTRSTQPLFSEPFRPGEASARIDRIALARASDLRDNRFARWGVKR